MDAIHFYKNSLFLLIISLMGLKPSYAQDSINAQLFGTIRLYHPQKSPTSLVLFVSGDGGWKDGVLTMARYLAQQGALVAGIDAKLYRNSLSKLKRNCLYPAADFEQLSMQLQRKFNFESYKKPILAGYSYGATLIYALLAQAPAGTFIGGIALGFCPDIALPKPLCAGNGLRAHVLKANASYYLEAVDQLSAPFIVLNGVKDQTCNFATTASFLKHVGHAQLVSLKQVGHGFSIADHWLSQFKAAYDQLDQLNKTAVKSNAISATLPIVQIHPSESSNAKQLLFIISGDGGWTSFDQGIAAACAKEGITVLGLDAQKYFWQKRSVAASSYAIHEAIESFLTVHPQYQVSLLGYSFGAGVAPFIAENLIHSQQLALKHLILLSADTHADFEIHMADMLHLGRKKQPYDVIAALKNLKAIHPICIFGSEEEQSIVKVFRQSELDVRILAGGHHYNNNYPAIVQAFIKNK